jgi:uncharacterized protein YcbK (DUF882 family)
LMMMRTLLFLLVATMPATSQTRSLYIKHRHTGEEERIVFKTGGTYDSAGLKKLNWMLRDWRTDEPREMDSELFDIIAEIYEKTGSSEPINVVSAYRSPGTNAALRRRSRGVARNSQHIEGKALDFYIPGVSTTTIREIALKMERGGVGFYPRAGTAFIHVDSGSVRHWPKMSRDQLARVFPDGKTVHIPRDGKPMGGFAVALASLEKRGGTFSRNARGEDDEGDGKATGDGGRLFAFLFGANKKPEPPRIQPAPPAAPQAVTVAYTKEEADEEPVVAAVKPVLRVASFTAPYPLAVPREREMMRSKLVLETAALKNNGVKMALAPLPVSRPEPEVIPFKVTKNTTLVMAAPLPLVDPRVKIVAKAVAKPLEKPVVQQVAAKEPVKILPTSFGKPLNSLSSLGLTGGNAFTFR